MLCCPDCPDECKFRDKEVMQCPLEQNHTYNFDQSSLVSDLQHHLSMDMSSLSSTGYPDPVRKSQLCTPHPISEVHLIAC
jgi:hypothetical protein